MSSSQPGTMSERAEVKNVFTLLAWVERDGTYFADDLSKAYEKIVFCRKNMFMLLTRKSKNKYIKEVTRLLDAWIQDTPLRSFRLKGIHIMPALLSQKPSKTSRSRDHSDTLERKLSYGKKVKLNP